MVGGVAGVVAVPAMCANSRSAVRDFLPKMANQIVVSTVMVLSACVNAQSQFAIASSVASGPRAQCPSLSPTRYHVSTRYMNMYG